MKNTTTTSKFPLPKDKGWSRLPERVEKLEEALEAIVIPTPEAPKYKIFTALLTQNGGDDPYNIGGGNLIIGATYQIVDNSGSADFTNVGAPNNNVDTYFIATDTTPNNWGSGTLLYNAGAPVAIVLENTIGNVAFTYQSIGNYACRSEGNFKQDKTTISIDTVGQNGNVPTVIIGNTTDNDENKFSIFTDKLGLTDGMLIKNRLEIKVYN
jgi:hypothetical protein